jgi:hypothetical protein
MSESDEDKPRPKRLASADASASAVSRELNEDEIDAPSKQTLVMLAVISASTLIMWAAGRAACNYQVEGENLTPRPVSLEQRTRTSKDVGLEFAQAVASGEFSIALQLSAGEAADWAKKEQSACGTCEQQRKAAKGRVFTSAAVLQANSKEALVKTRTIGAPGGEVTRFLGVEREGRNWRVTRISTDAAGIELKEPPSPSEPPVTAPPAPPADAVQEPEITPKDSPDGTSASPVAPLPPSTAAPSKAQP